MPEPWRRKLSMNLISEESCWMCAGARATEGRKGYGQERRASCWKQAEKHLLPGLTSILPLPEKVRLRLNSMRCDRNICVCLRKEILQPSYRPQSASEHSPASAHTHSCHFLKRFWRTQTGKFLFLSVRWAILAVCGPESIRNVSLSWSSWPWFWPRGPRLLAQWPR